MPQWHTLFVFALLGAVRFDKLNDRVAQTLLSLHSSIEYQNAGAFCPSPVELCTGILNRFYSVVEFIETYRYALNTAITASF